MAENECCTDVVVRTPSFFSEMNTATQTTQALEDLEETILELNAIALSVVDSVNSAAASAVAADSSADAAAASESGVASNAAAATSAASSASASAAEAENAALSATLSAQACNLAEAAAELAEANAEIAEANAEAAAASTAQDLIDVTAISSAFGDVAAIIDAVEAARDAAQLAELNAELAETNAETAEANAELAEVNAEAARDASIVAQVAAELAETNAETAAINAAASAVAAAASEAAAELAETNAASAAAAAAASEAALIELVPVTGTPVATTSGTSIELSGIPSWASKVKIILNSVTLDDNSPLYLRLGTVGGIENTGYLSRTMFISSISSPTSSFILGSANTTNAEYTGLVELIRESGNVWAESGDIFSESTPTTYGVSTGIKGLSGALTRVVLVSASGSANFTGGSVTLRYEL